MPVTSLVTTPPAIKMNQVTHQEDIIAPMTKRTTKIPRPPEPVDALPSEVKGLANNGKNGGMHPGKIPGPEVGFSHKKLYS